MVEVIVRGFARGGLSNNSHKRHLQAITAQENKKVKLDNMEKGLVISFFNDEYLEGFNCDHDDPMVITVTIHNSAIKKNSYSSRKLGTHFI